MFATIKSSPLLHKKEIIKSYDIERLFCLGNKKFTNLYLTCNLQIVLFTENRGSGLLINDTNIQVKNDTYTQHFKNQFLYKYYDVCFLVKVISTKTPYTPC